MADELLVEPASDAKGAEEAPIALVTGAAHGLGQAVALSLGQRGYTVLLAARSKDQAAIAADGLAGVESLPVDLDIRDSAAVHAAAAWVENHFGRLDVLVNNASAHPDMSETVSNADLDKSTESLDITLFGTWRVIQAFLPLITRAEHPRIVNVTSGAGSHEDRLYGIPHNAGRFASHGIAKAAQNALTATLAAELEGTPVLVNAVCPGVTVSDPAAGPPGARTPEQSSFGVVWAATLGDDGPSGGLFRDCEPLSW